MYNAKSLNEAHSFEMQAIIHSVERDIVMLDCLLNPDEYLFEFRPLPKVLFENIEELDEDAKLEEGQIVTLSFKVVPGSQSLYINVPPEDEKLTDIFEVRPPEDPPPTERRILRLDPSNDE